MSDMDEALEVTLDTSSEGKRKSRKNNSAAKQLNFPFETLLPPNPSSVSRYPTLFTKLPIFEPIKTRSIADTKGWGENDGDTYSIGDFSIKRFGPGLSIYDEDTLISILQLGAQKSLKGTRAVINEHLTGGRSIMEESDSSSIEEVYVGCVTPYRINDYLSRGTGGDQLKSCQESMDRLGLTQLLFFSESNQKVGNTKFFEFIRDYDVSGDVYIKIESTMVNLLKEYTTIDMTIRKELSDVGKSCHRYFSGEGQNFSITLLELMEKIRYRGELKDFKRALLGRGATKSRKAEVGQLQILKDLNWFEDYEVSGTGRKTPYVLHAQRRIPTETVDELADESGVISKLFK